MSGYAAKSLIVKQMKGIEISGNVIPATWYKTILAKNGKANVLAISILGDIVYWYRPVEVRDETTGHFIGLKQKFKADLLQRSYQSFADYYNCSKRQATNAIIALEELGVVKRVFRNKNIGGRAVNNILYLELNPERLYELTYPDQETMFPLSQKNVTAPTLKSDSSIQKEVIAVTQNGETNTENTTKINDKDYHILSNQAEEDFFKKQIGYDALKHDMPFQKEVLDNIVSLVVDVLTSQKEKIKIGGEEKQSEVVKSQFRRLNMEHIRYVLACMEEYTGEVRNIKSFTITCLYNAVLTMSLYHSQKVNHDLYGDSK